jgi:predicted RNA-binding protein YlqC (UPF0109 family)
MKEFLEFMARHLVDRPESVHVETEDREDRVVYRLSVDPADVGKIIGKQGRTAQALRTLMIAAAGRAGKKAMLDIVQ